MATNQINEETQVLEMAEALALVLKDTPVLQHFVMAERLFREDPGVQTMIKTLRHKAEEFQRAERAGNLNEAQVKEFREMQARFQAHPLLRNFQEAQQAAGFLLKETNAIISRMLGVDFARNGRAAGGCC